MAFLPSDLSALEVWLEADSGITLNGSNVASWTDQSGNAHSASASSSVQPAYVASAINGLPGINYTSGKLLNDTASAMGDMTVFVVGKVDAAAAATYLALASWGASYQPDLYLQSAGGGNYFHAVQWGSSVANSTGLSTPRNVPFLYQTTIDAVGKTIRSRLNAAEAAGNPYSAAGVGTTPTGFTIGTDGPDQYTGIIAAFLVFRRKLTTAETQQVESYLALKYGLGFGYLAGTSTTTTTSTGAISATGQIAGTSTSTTSSSGALTGLANLAGASASTSDSTGVLTGLGALAGASSSSSSSTASALTGVGDLAGTSTTSTASVAAALTGAADLSGASSSSTSSSGELTGFGALAGTSTTTTSSTGDLTALSDGSLSGTSVTTTASSGVLTGLAGLAGASASVSASTASALTGFAQLAGESTTETSSSGELTALATLGQLAGTSVTHTSSVGTLTGTVTALPSPRTRRPNDDDIGGYFQYATDLSLPWSSGPYGLAWSQAKGLLNDRISGAYEAAVRVRFVKTCPDDALPQIGRDRRLERYPGEDVRTYRRRLAGAWGAYQRAGTKAGLVAALADAGVDALVYESWEADYGPRFSAWFWYHVVVPLPGLTLTDGTWDDPGTWDETALWDATGDATIELVRRVCATWAPAHAKLATITLVLDTGTWDYPPGLWSDELGLWGESLNLQWVNYAGSPL